MKNYTDYKKEDVKCCVEFANSILNELIDKINEDYIWELEDKIKLNLIPELNGCEGDENKKRVVVSKILELQNKKIGLEFGEKIISDCKEKLWINYENGNQLIYQTDHHIDGLKDEEGV